MNTAIINRQSAYFLSSANAVSAAEVLKTVQESMDAQFSNQLHAIITLANELPACSGSILEMHFNKSEGCFDFACRLNAAFDRPVLSVFHRQNSIPGFPGRGYCSLLDASLTRHHVLY